MCQPVSCQSRFSFIFFVQQEPEPEPEPRARIRFRFLLGQNDTVPAPVPQHCCVGRVESVYLPIVPLVKAGLLIECKLLGFIQSIKFNHALSIENLAFLSYAVRM